ncbi:MAG TPA: heparan-alpha-glucosaminide N-acetyltransferase domain-containing protein [Pyrinomonadaceae bacterium]|nr:heparan-alpha-glucosaminide N-acetyltransferase domain-containing protein [Pyrinomonadaceae bacterium]
MDAVTGEPEAGQGAGRLVSLDVFRGLTIAGMILVNNPGTWGAIYDPLEHAEWHGWTPTDFIFPFFLFIVGVSITLALAHRAESGGSKRGLYFKIFRRALIIFGLGLFLGGFPSFDLSTIRVPGVLQRIAVCYLVSSLVFLKTGWRAQGFIAAALLLLYWMLLTLVPAPGFAAGDLSMEGSLASYVDRRLLAGHTWKPLYDPEGILSTIPAVATTLCGVLTGHVLRSRRTPLEKVTAMFVAGAAGVVAGWAWNFWFPVNKALWTSSYVLFTAGMALQLLALCYWLIDVKGLRRWAKPFVVFGTNALALYFLAELFSNLISTISLARADGTRADLKTLIFENVFAPWASPEGASLMFALSIVLLWLGVMAVLYRRRIFIKV